MSDEQEKTGPLGITPVQVAAGALAAVTAAVLGARLNVAGTVAGAAVASVVSTIGSALYQRSLERTTESVRKVGSRAWVIRPARGETPVGADTASPGERVHAIETPPARATRPRWHLAAAASVLVFVIGMLAVTGIEWARGESLSGDGSATTIGAITEGGGSGGGRRQEEQRQEEQRQEEQRQTPGGTDAPSASEESATTAPSTGPSSGSAPTPGSPETSSEPTETSGSPQTSEGVTSAPARPEVMTPSQPTVAPTTGG
ncbi:hypothetical protein [Umezawaea beigongshangensis]|uniref:hypothetical protein n=1 Tax=Umezawaea beigongshangensis TaxID=2780383 RepID=UPI0018F1B61F|nr:hypothetical protein [Umezawaea beigongshangensis]